MRKALIRLPAFALAGLLLAPAAPGQGAEDAVARVRVTNPSAVARPDEVVAIPWATLRRQAPGLDPARVRVVEAATGRDVATQLVDADGDGQADELLLLAGFWPREEKRFVIAAGEPAPVPPRVYATHIEERDDLAWESDRIAFRTYGQGLWEQDAQAKLVSSGIDVWPKRVRDLVIDRWYAKGHDAYHQDTGEGADFFDVGPTLGAGGTAVYEGGALHRPENFAGYRLIAAGPIRAIFELDYEPWEAGGLRVSQTKRVTIDAGQHFFREESTFHTDAVDTVTYAVGLVERAGVVASQDQTGPWTWLSLWGPVLPKNGGHGALGTAVLLATERLVRVGRVEGHHVALAKARAGVPVVHYVGAGWTASGDFDTVEGWWAYLEQLRQRLSAPLEVEVLPPS